MACTFCEIVAGRLPSRIVHQDDGVVAFHDVNPQAPVHVLLVPRQHVASLSEVGPEHDGLVGRLVRQARDLAAQLGLGKRGFRLVFNTGDDAGYSVHHVHLHLIGGRRLGWPPG